MRRHFLIFISFILFLFSPIVVKANFGDVRYEITNVDLNGDKITFEGWAFIHKTNNYKTLVDNDGNVKMDDGDQKVIIKAYYVDSVGREKLAGMKVFSAGEQKNTEDEYNFYCELFTKGGNRYRNCGNAPYYDIGYNSCNLKEDGSSQCYYEDIYFKITFDTSRWKNNSNVIFKIGVSNKFFEDKIKSNSYSYSGFFEDENGDIYTKLVDLSVAKDLIPNNNAFFNVVESSFSTKVEYIAHLGLLHRIDDFSQYYKYSGHQIVAVWKDDVVGNGYGNYKIYNLCNKNNIFELDTTFNDTGRSSLTGKCGDFAGRDCMGTFRYAIKVSKSFKSAGLLQYVACPSNDSRNEVTVLTYGSHVRPSAIFKIKTKSNKKSCKVNEKNNINLECNKNLNLSSVCEELTVEGVGVKIEQTGTLSNVLTPDDIYEGGGFKFGIVYYNKIKWSYINDKPNADLHAVVQEKMNDKIKDYTEYTENIKIDNLKLGGYIIDGSKIVKKCYASNKNINYYGNDGLSVSCVFTFTESDINKDGAVIYKNSADSILNINNKYYTVMREIGNLEITGNISGLNRITTSSAKNDSEDKDKNIPWTEQWTVSFDKCNLNVYPLFYVDPDSDNNNKNTYMFIYRPIDVENPFPNRNAGINWYEWYNDNNNKEKLTNTYDSTNKQYSVVLDNNKIASIKNYNKGKNYLEWESINDDNEKSSFVTEYVQRVGAN